MAGIGFELKKIFKEDSVFGMAAGISYSTLITIGPTVIVMGILVLLYLIMGISSVSYASRELLSTTILYVFIFSAIITSAFNAVFSRYIADKFYEEKYDTILSSYYSGLCLLGAISTLIAIPFCYHLYHRGGVDFPFVAAAYLLWIVTVMLFFAMTYLHATKDYKVIAGSFFVGMVVGFICAILCSQVGKVDVIHSILYGLTLGFFIIGVLVTAYIRRYFSVADSGFWESIAYIGKFKTICLANFFYFLGLYIHNFVFWTTEDRMVVADTMVCMQPYDMATCLALFTNISTIMIFTVMAETEFHDCYQKYMESVIGSTYEDITKNKKHMFRVMKQQIGHVFAIQTILTAVIFLVFTVFLPRYGFGGLTMEIYPALAVGYLAIFITYCVIIYLFYFNDNRGAMYTSIIFCAAILIATLFTKELPANLYGLGTLIGAIVGWTFGYFRLRVLEHKFDKHIFANVKLLNEHVVGNNKHMVYKKPDPKKAEDEDENKCNSGSI